MGNLIDRTGMNYIEAVNHFWAVQGIRDDLGPKEISLFFYLLNAANRLHWPEDFEISVTRARAQLGLGHQSTFQRSRERLENAGLIAANSQKGTKKLKFSVLFPSKTATRPATPREDKQTEQRDRQAGSSDSDSLNFESLVSEVQEAFPNRADVRDIAELMQSLGGKQTAFRLKRMVKNEREPRSKPPPPKPEAVEPQGWQDHAPGDLGARSWEYVLKEYPEIAAEIRAKTATGTATRIATESHA